MDVMEFLNQKLGGCGVESEKLEAAGLIDTLIRAYTNGELTEQEYKQILNQLCIAISNLAQRCGRALDVEKCVVELDNVVKSNIDVSVVGSSIRQLLVRKRMGKRLGGGGII